MKEMRSQVRDQGVAMRDIQLTGNMHVKVLSSSAPRVLPKGTEAEVTAVHATSVEINCKDGGGAGIHAWGLKLSLAKVVWGISFSKSGKES